MIATENVQAVLFKIVKLAPLIAVKSALNASLNTENPNQVIHVSNVLTNTVLIVLTLLFVLNVNKGISQIKMENAPLVQFLIVLLVCMAIFMNVKSAKLNTD